MEISGVGQSGGGGGILIVSYLVYERAKGPGDVISKEVRT